MDNTFSANKQFQLTALESLSRKIIHKVLAKLTNGYLQLNEGENKFFFGSKNSKTQAEITVKNGVFYQKILFSGSIGAGESFIDNDWESPDVTQFIYLFAINLSLLDKLESYLNWLSLPMNKLNHFFNKNSLSGAKKNILAHYDISNDFYQLFLDKEMLYSSALYPDVNTDIEKAQQYKLKMICERLNIKQDQNVLEIGTGWGALAIYMAKNYDANVTTTTISEAQYQYAKKRIETENLSHKITLLKQDYRQLSGQYDRLVSIEMIEAVGHEYMAGFFKKINSLIKPSGRILIQAITIADQRYDNYRKNVDFIQKYIFPGGCLPSISVMASHLKKSTKLALWSLDDIGQDYAQTLKQWREKFNHALTSIEKQGFNNEFIRMWLFYFYYCEAGFLARTTSAVHLVAVGSEYQASLSESSMKSLTNKLNNTD